MDCATNTDGTAVACADTSAAANTDSSASGRAWLLAGESVSLDGIWETFAEMAEPFAALAEATEQIATLFGATLAAVVLLGEGVGGRHLAVSEPSLRADAEQCLAQQMRDRSGWLEALRLSGFDVVEDEFALAALPEGWATLMPSAGSARLLVVPLAMRGRTTGGLVIVRAPEGRAFDGRDTRLARSLANILALGIHAAVQSHALDGFFDVSPALLCTIDTDGRLGRLNPQWGLTVGQDPRDLEGVMFFDLVHPDDRPAASAAPGDLFQEQVSAQFVNRIRGADGSYRSIEWVVRPSAGMAYAFGKDITSQLADERAFRESETRLRDLAFTSEDWLWEVDAEARYTMASGKAEEVLGYHPDEFVGRSPLYFMSPDEAARMAPLLAGFHESQEGVSGLIARHVHKDGREVVLMTNHVPIYDSFGVFAGFRGVDRDVTDRETLVLALKESESRYRLLAENTNDVLALLDAGPLTFEYVSPSVQRLTGHTAEELAGQSLACLLPPAAFRRAQEAAEAHRVSFEHGDMGAGHYLVETEFLTKRGGTLPVEISVELLADAYGRVSKHVALCRDITDRKATEVALGESNRRLQDMMLLSGDWIWEADAEYRYTQCSEGVSVALGYRPSDVIGKTPLDFAVSLTQEETRRHVLEQLAHKTGCRRLISRRQHRDGHEVILLTSSMPILDDSGELLGFRGIDKDVTAAVQTEDALRRSALELDALWRIAQSVAGPGRLGQALGDVTQRIADILGARFALSVLFGESEDEEQVVAFRAPQGAGYDGDYIRRAAVQLSRLVRTWKTKKPVVRNRPRLNPVRAPRSERADGPGFSRLLIVPLVLQGKIIGALMVTRSADEPIFERRDVDFAQAAATNAAAAAMHARLLAAESRRTAGQVREHIARDLHDAVTQSVYSANLIAQALPTIFRRSPDDAMVGLEQLQRLVKSALAELRILLYELRPGSLADVSLEHLLDRLGDSLAVQADVTVEIDARIAESLTEGVKDALYRIAHEAFNNIAKHARAHRAAASVVTDRSGLVLQVEDDGVGFDLEAVTGDHMGLAIMRERAQEIGAEFRIERIEPCGTRITVRLAAPGGETEA